MSADSILARLELLTQSPRVNAVIIAHRKGRWVLSIREHSHGRPIRYPVDAERLDQALDQIIAELAQGI